MSETEVPQRQRPCTKCRENPAGPGGILCPECKAAIETRIYPSTNPVLAEEIDQKIADDDPPPARGGHRPLGRHEWLP